MFDLYKVNNQAAGLIDDTFCLQYHSLMIVYIWAAL